MKLTLTLVLLVVLGCVHVHGSKWRKRKNKTVLVEPSGTKENEEIEPELFEGDIVVNPRIKKLIEKIHGTNPETDNDSEDGDTTFDALNYGQWTDGEIPYNFASGFSFKRIVKLAINEYTAKTCIKFRARKPTDKHYIQFFHGTGCYSTIGRRGGIQRISLGRRCGKKGIAIHEMMHAIGFYHEQSRIDRDDYITINWDNIPKKWWYNFEKYDPRVASTLKEPYDKDSIMHYTNYAFTNNGRMTILSKSNPRETLGQRIRLSEIDVKQINKYYKCTTATKTPLTPTLTATTSATTTTTTTKSTTTTTESKEINKVKTPEAKALSSTTITTPTTKPSASTCIDKLPLCDFFSNAGMCKYSRTIQKRCKKSCKLCTECVDMNKHCDAWAQGNVFCKFGCCNNAKYGSSMQAQCKKSCGMC